MPAPAGAIVGGVLAAVFIILVVLVIIVILVMKLRRSKMPVQSLQTDVLSSPNPEAMVHYELNTEKLQKSKAESNLYSRHMLASPSEEVPVRSASDASRMILSRYSANSTGQMSRHMKITKNQLMLEEKIGTGEFGIVYRALLTEHDGEIPKVVAVKTLKGLYDHNEIHKIMDESLKMRFFNHQNVLSLIGVCLDTGAAPYIIMPYMANGSLQQYLKKERANVDENEVEDVQKRLTVMCLHIAQGMQYLAEQHFIHRDLASRNCMIDEDFVIKIADFGLSEDIYAKSYFRQEKDVSIKLPVKWMAPESLNDGIFSEKSDVWSFGVTCWEVFNGGKSPYPGVGTRALCEMLDNGERLDKPNNAACPDHMFGVMHECWELDSRNRPTFSEIVTSVASFATNLAGYVDFSEFNPFEPSEHSQRPSRTSIVLWSHAETALKSIM